MNISNNNSSDNFLKEWNKYSKYLWFDNDINIWLDISKINFNEEIISKYEKRFENVFTAITKLESGEYSNIDENRQVGHYWLRNSSLSPNNNIKNSIDSEIEKIKSFGKKIINGDLKNIDGKSFTDVLWIGIGGSALGPLLIIESLQVNDDGLKFSFIDNIDPFLISEKLELLSTKLSTTLFVVVSKSGGTPEPRIAMEIIRKNIIKKNINWSSQSVAITMKDSKLYEIAKRDNWLEIFDLPDWVGGRTSITSSVGLLPLALINQDILIFLDGASKMDQLTRNTDIYKNPSALLAISWYLCGDGEGRRDMVVLPYRDRLQVFSKYLQQLIMESLGKKLDRNGSLVHQGISVFGNKGSTDQHAYVQQLRDGIDNFFCIFIELLDYPFDLDHTNLDNPKDYLSGFLQGTRQALSNEGRQSITITLDKLNSYSLGSLIALFERAVSFYAELININAYDQPGVEAGKKAAAKVIDLQKEIQSLLNTGKTYTFDEILSLNNENNPENIFFILRQMTYANPNYLVEGNWSKPESLIFMKK